MKIMLNIVRAFRLLIVPYGIETPKKVALIITIILLIVPYGIETSGKRISVFCDELLIVHY